MGFQRKGRGVIRLHDTTTHGGEVVSVKHTYTKINGRPVACVGDMVRCDKCEGVFRIVEGDDECRIKNDPVSFDGHKTACGAALISSEGSAD